MPHSKAPQSRSYDDDATLPTLSSDPTHSALSAKERIDQINKRNRHVDQEELALKRKLVPRLAKRAYHLEDDNTWCQDWIQYQKNTHPVFGLCMYHRLHPIRLPQRIIILVGSISFGFAITNCVYLGFLSHENAGRVVNGAYDVAGNIADFQQRYTTIEVQQSMVFLLTVGSFLHSVFDMSIWYLMACFCCRPGGPCQGNGEGRLRRMCQAFGIYVAALVVIVAVVAATGVAIARLTADQDAIEKKSSTYLQDLAAQELGLDDPDGEEASSKANSNLTFLLGYALELVFALFVFYFLTSTVFFSGILGCGRIPILGGRPYEIRQAKLLRKGSKGEGSDGGGDEEYMEAVEVDARGRAAMQVYKV